MENSTRAQGIEPIDSSKKQFTFNIIKVVIVIIIMITTKILLEDIFTLEHILSSISEVSILALISFFSLYYLESLVIDKISFLKPLFKTIIYFVTTSLISLIYSFFIIKERMNFDDDFINERHPYFQTLMQFTATYFVFILLGIIIYCLISFVHKHLFLKTQDS